MSALHQRPDFMIIGGQFDGQVWLMASRSLQWVEVKEDFGYEDIHGCYSDRMLITRHTIDFKTRVRDYVMVVADSYPEAWASLFDVWSPPSRAELPGQKALP